jgi:OmpA-OmpF porin, OOP family
MKKVTNTIAFIISSAISVTALAQNTQRDARSIESPYIGANIGPVGARANGTNLKDGTTAAKNGSGFKLYSGYQLNQNLGAELGFIRSSDLKRSFLVNTANVEQTGKVNAFYAAATARLPLSEQFSMNAKLGVARCKFSGTSQLPAASAITGNKTGLILGAGTEYRFTQKVAGTLDFDYLPNTSARLKTTLISAGIKAAF